MGIGSTVKKLLKEKKMSIKQLSEETGISINTLYDITKRDNKTVRSDILKKIAEALDTDANYLLMDDLGLTEDIIDTLTFRQRHLEAYMYSGDSSSSYKNIAIAQNAILKDNAFLAEVAEYIATPEIDESIVVQGTGEGEHDYIWTQMKRDERLAYYSGRVVQRLPGLRENALRKDVDEKED